MKKQLIATAVTAITAAAIGFTAVAQADATFYGRVVAGAVYSDNDKGDDSGAWNFGAVGEDGGNAFSSSRFGFKGSTDLGNGASAGFKIEREIDGSNTEDAKGNGNTEQRHNNVYVAGNWGKLTLGHDSNPYMNARNWDQTNFRGGQFGASYRHEGVKYSMSSGPFSLNIVALANDTFEDDTSNISVNLTDVATTDYALTNVVSIGLEDFGAVLTGDPATAAVAAGTAVTIDADNLADANVARVLLVAVDANEINLQDSEITGDDGVDGWIIQAGYDFGFLALNVAHHADNRDVKVNGSFSELLQTNNSALTDVSGASRDRTAIGVNGSAGPLDWYAAYETSEINASGTAIVDNDIDSFGGFLGFNMSEKDVLYGYYVAHSADRSTYDAAGTETLGEDYTETILGYSRQIGPGVKFIAEYTQWDYDLAAKDAGSDRSMLDLAVKYDF